ncbi:hypothetical protein KIW84_044900 [Lathyrus oleraceus]|uniref:Uncharacterized protein n=1 Tax=Pisum sativum TaxID=3888 RepID=A0A9D5AWG6_PEA|nr:hypothetical protein KIW84_044900 [Pisum sativum]
MYGEASSQLALLAQLEAFSKQLATSTFIPANVNPVGVLRYKATSSANLEASETQHQNESIKVVDYELLETDPRIRPPISSYHPDIQNEVRKAYLKIDRHQPPHNFVYPWSVQDDVFYVLIDEFGDVAGKEQMAIVIRYVNNEGKINILVNFIRSSNKRQELFRDKPVTQFAKLIEEGQIETGSGLNQESSISRVGDTRRGSHFRNFTSLMTLYCAIIGLLEEFGNATSFEKYGETMFLFDVLRSFDFIFMLYMMFEILRFINDLSVALQKRDQDLLNALSLVNATKQELQEMRNDGWEELISKIMEICNKHDIDVPDMDAPYVQGKKPR